MGYNGASIVYKARYTEYLKYDVNAEDSRHSFESG